MFKATRAMAMRPSAMMMMRQTPRMTMRQSPQLFVRQTLQMRSPVPIDHASAHTASQRLRQLKNIPTEIWPLNTSPSIAVAMAIFSLGRKLWVDKTLRLKRQGKEQ
ncbi:hypothetical protein SVAN01_00233 [Stagonosporopsis vannaccii]|nr:hypothetical protein SVAN01_00233 [Stagonosporopsis vannaccii]